MPEEFMLQHSRALIAYAALIASMLALLAWQLSQVPQVDLHGAKTRVVDIWVLGHMLFGVVLMGGWQRLVGDESHKPWYVQRAFLLVLATMCAWEVLELPTELGLLDQRLAHWMAGIESSMNRFVVDPLVGILGALTCRRFPRIWFPCLTLGLLFEAAHIAAPTAMTIQESILTFIL